MLDSKNLVELIKQISADTEKTASPCDFCYGKVISESPIQILVEQKLTLSEMQLVLTRNVTDFEIEVDFKDEKVLKNEPAPTAHEHIIGKHKITVPNSLKTGELVILLRQRGGQKYLVLDRTVSI